VKNLKLKFLLKNQQEKINLLSFLRFYLLYFNKKEYLKKLKCSNNYKKIIRDKIKVDIHIIGIM